MYLYFLFFVWCLLRTLFFDTDEGKKILILEKGQTQPNLVYNTFFILTNFFEDGVLSPTVETSVLDTISFLQRTGCNPRRAPPSLYPTPYKRNIFPATGPLKPYHFNFSLTFLTRQESFNNKTPSKPFFDNRPSSLHYQFRLYSHESVHGTSAIALISSFPDTFIIKAPMPTALQVLRKALSHVWRYRDWYAFHVAILELMVVGMSTLSEYIVYITATPTDAGQNPSKNISPESPSLH
jgi:hypothetical protein